MVSLKIDLEEAVSILKREGYSVFISVGHSDNGKCSMDITFNIHGGKSFTLSLPLSSDTCMMLKESTKGEQ